MHLRGFCSPARDFDRNFQGDRGVLRSFQVIGYVAFHRLLKQVDKVMSFIFACDILLERWLNGGPSLSHQLCVGSTLTANTE
jgi:hypothetical protein